MDDLFQSATGPVIDLVADAFDQATGRNSGKWKLVLVAFIGGAVLVAWIVRRQRAQHAPSAPGGPTPLATATDGA